MHDLRLSRNVYHVSSTCPNPHYSGDTFHTYIVHMYAIKIIVDETKLATVATSVSAVATGISAALPRLCE